ncbi:gluconokinase [Rhizocola hellebori]|nr:gluconokinase [Rhizocola hellebori]
MTVLVVLGVAGSGKSTVGAALAARMGVPFADGDDLHPRSNVEKMAAGRPLSDTDRWPWLDRIRSWMSDHDPSVVACSALKPGYRDRLRPAQFVYLKIGRELAQERLTGRFGHFFKADLLDSQFAALQEPGPEELDVLTIDSTASVEDLVQFIIDNVSGLASGQSQLPGQ